MEIVDVKEYLKKKVEERCRELERKNNELSKMVSCQGDLIGARHLNWDMIIVEENKVRPYLDFIQDKENTIQAARKHIQASQCDMDKRPLDTAESAIKFLNSLTDEDIRRGNIRDRIPTITWARKVICKHRHINMVEAKWNFMRKQADDFFEKAKPLVQRGIPFF